jgi:hypothetical protein
VSTGAPGRARFARTVALPAEAPARDAMGTPDAAEDAGGATGMALAAAAKHCAVLATGNLSPSESLAGTVSSRAEARLREAETDDSDAAPVKSMVPPPLCVCLWSSIVSRFGSGPSLASGPTGREAEAEPEAKPPPDISAARLGRVEDAEGGASAGVETDEEAKDEAEAGVAVGALVDI